MVDHQWELAAEYLEIIFNIAEALFTALQRDTSTRWEGRVERLYIRALSRPFNHDSSVTNERMDRNYRV